MPEPTLNYLLAVVRVYTAQLRRRARTGDRPADAGVSTLEVVIITAGLAALAAVVVAAITVAVNSHKAQIK